ncbi:MAG: enoyl-CoA hydratase-related protein [Bacteroidota bacterium]
MPPILFDIQDQVARIRLNRPEVFNSFNREMALSLQSYLQQCQEDAAIRSVYLTGKGRAFCAGQDLQEVSDPDQFLGFERVLNEHYNPIIRLMRQLEKPVVVAVNGVAAGAGANIALAGDVVVASEKANFLQAFSKIGLIPDSAGTYFLPRLIGWQKASALMMLGEKVKAEEAERMGMIFRVYPVEEFAAASWQLALQLAKMPTRGLAMTKQALNQAMGNELEAQLALETDLQTQAGATEDYAEGLQAFLEKRAPDFKGQ